MVAVNCALATFSGIVTEAGTITDALLLDKATVIGPLEDTAFSFTVQISVPAPRAGVCVAQ